MNEFRGSVVLLEPSSTAGVRDVQFLVAVRYVQSDTCKQLNLNAQAEFDRLSFFRASDYTVRQK